jgi:hypothetical protein
VTVAAGVAPSESPRSNGKESRYLVGWGETSGKQDAPQLMVAATIVIHRERYLAAGDGLIAVQKPQEPGVAMRRQAFLGAIPGLEPPDPS